MREQFEEALSQISISCYQTVGALAFPPSLLFSHYVLNFVQAWNSYRVTAQTNDESEQYIKDFLDKVEASCLHFSQYDKPKNTVNINTIIAAVMFYIPWEYLPESERQKRLMKIFEHKEFRKRVWDRHLELLNPHLAKNPNDGLLMNVAVARTLLEFEDLQNELMDLPLKQRSLFANAIPELVAKKPALYNLLSEDNKRALLQSMLNPQSMLSLKILFNQLSDQSRSSVQSPPQNNTLYQPLPGSVNAQDQLSTILTELSIKLRGYLGNRKVDGLKFSIGFFNSTLSTKKNALVSHLLSNIDTKIKKIGSATTSTFKMDDLLTELSMALQLNEQYHKDYARRISLGGLTLIQIDGPGQLGSYLKAAYNSLKQFQNTQSPEPESSPPSSQCM